MALTKEDKEEIKEMTANIERTLNGLMKRIDTKIISIEADSKKILESVYDIRIEQAVVKRDVYFICALIGLVSSSAIALIFRKF